MNNLISQLYSILLPRFIQKKEIKKRFNWLLIEQDIQSPHRYLTEQFKFNEGDVLIDVEVVESELL
jgi:hypothetical protein